MPPIKRSIRFALLLSVFLLPVAHLKVVIFGIPFYSVELPIVVALFAYGWGWRKKIFLPRGVSVRDPFFLGIALFVSGALLSFFANPFSLTGLGMLKTWFAFPLVWVWLWIETDPDSPNTEYALLWWLGSIALGSFASMTYFFRGALSYDGRLMGWYTSPNYLAFFLAPGILLAYSFCFHPLFSKKKIFRYVFFAVLLLLAVTVFFTHSYGVWSGIVLAGLFILFFDKTVALSWHKKVFAIILLGVLCGIFIFFESGSEKWQALTSFQERSSFSSRIMIWQAAIKIIGEHFFLGIGIGRFQEVYLSYQQYFPPYLEWAVPQPHNVYLALWLQTGLVGLAGFVFLVSAWIARMMAIVSSRSSGAAQSTAVLLIALLILTLVTGITDTPFFKTDLAYMFWYCIAFGIGFLNRQKSARDCNKGASIKS